MLKAEHELHRRRFSRNVGLAVTLAAFVVLVFALTVVKATNGDPMRGFDHTRESTPGATTGAAP